MARIWRVLLAISKLNGSRFWLVPEWVQVLSEKASQAPSEKAPSEEALLQQVPSEEQGHHWNHQSHGELLPVVDASQPPPG